MNEKRRAWTPERVEQLIEKVDDLGVCMANLVVAEERVAEVLEYLKADSERFKDNAKKALEEEEPEAGE